jgi:uncharacterized membrane protein
MSRSETFLAMQPGRTQRVLQIAIAMILTLAAAAFAARFIVGPHYAPGQAPPMDIWITLHLITVLPAALLGIWLLGSRKGSQLHRRLGYLWCGLMVTTSLVALMIRGYFLPNLHGINPIHIFSIITLIGVPQAVLAARRHDVVAHRNGVFGMCMGGLFCAGLFAFMPGRTLGNMLMGWM